MIVEFCLTVVAHPGEITKRHDGLFLFKNNGGSLSQRENFLTQQKGKGVKILYLFDL